MRSDRTVQASLVARVAITLALAIIVIATLPPTAAADRPVQPWCVLCGDRDAADAILNILLFAPFGAALALARVRRARTVWLGAGLSLAVELLQTIVPGRDPNARDLIANTVGTAVGALIPGLIIREITRVPARGLIASLPAISITAAALWTSAALLAPSYPTDQYYSQWVPPRPNWEPFPGRVVSAQIGDVPLPNGPLGPSNDVLALVREGTALDIRAIAGPPTSSLSPVFAIVDEHERELLLIGVDQRELFLRIRTRSAEVHLDQPPIRIAHMIPAVRPTDTLRFRVWRAGPRLCAAVDSSLVCDLGFTIGSGWRALYAGSSFRPWLRRVCGLVWITALVLPFAFGVRTPTAWAVGGVVLIATLVFAPIVFTINATAIADWAAVAVGIALGSPTRRAIGRRSRSA